MIISLATRDAERGRRETSPLAAWRAALEHLRDELRGPSPPAIDDLPNHVQSLPADQRREALADLIAEHLTWSWAQGNGPLLDAYVGLLAGLPSSAIQSGSSGASADVPASLVEDELLARYQAPHGDRPRLAEYERRFATRPDVLTPLRNRYLEEGRLTRLDCVGRGGRATVWRGYDHVAKRFVAIKQPRIDATEAAHEAALLAAEARIMSLMDHQGILRIERLSITSDGAPLLVLPWLDGVRLSERIAAHHNGGGERDDRPRLLGAFVAVCEAIGHAHERGVIHGDLKPGNVMMSPAHEPVIIDWGMAQLAGSPGAPPPEAPGEAWAPRANLAGTPAYMAPEQVDGVADAYTDVFGLGAVLYELLTGRPPHHWAASRPPADWRSTVRSAAFPSPRQVRRDTPRDLDAICRRALAPQPCDRFPSAGALAQAVRSHLLAAARPWWLRAVSRLRAGRRA